MTKHPRKPRGLKAAGTRLWESVIETYDLDDYPEKLEALESALPPVSESAS